MKTSKIKQINMTSLFDGTPISELLGADGEEVTSVWEIDGTLYWEDPYAATLRTGTIHEFVDWLVTKTA